MKSRTKVWLAIAVSFIIGGIALAGVGVALGATVNFSYYFKDGHIGFKEGSEQYVDGTIPVEDFKNLTVKTDVIDVRIVENADNNSVIYHVPEECIPTVTGTDNLKVETPDADDVFFNFLDFNTDDSPYIIINIRNSGIERHFDITTSTGDINIADTAFSGYVSASTGDIRLASVTAGTLRIETSTGDISIENTKSPEINIQTSTGENEIDNCTIDHLALQTSTGDIKISSSTLETLTVNGRTSDLEVDDSSAKGIKVDLSTGECKLDINGSMDDYSCRLSSSTGDIEYDGNEYEKSYNRDGNGTGSIIVTTSTGDIEVKFYK